MQYITIYNVIYKILYMIIFGNVKISISFGKFVGWWGLTYLCTKYKYIIIISLTWLFSY